VPPAGDPPRYCAVLDPIAFRCGSRKTERQEKHAEEDGHRQGRCGDEEPAHKLASLVTDRLQSCGVACLRFAPNTSQTQALRDPNESLLDRLWEPGLGQGGCRRLPSFPASAPARRLGGEFERTMGGSDSPLCQKRRGQARPPSTRAATSERRALPGPVHPSNVQAFARKGERDASSRTPHSRCPKPGRTPIATRTSFGFGSGSARTAARAGGGSDRAWPRPRFVNGANLRLSRTCGNASNAPPSLLTRHLPVSKEGVPARGADVQTEALDDHAMKVRASAHTNLVAPIDLRKSTWRIAVLLRESRAPE
jgi:hypothetical protein